jgi:hypothetical protein
MPRFPLPRLWLLLLAGLLFPSSPRSAQAIDPPRLLIDGWRIELVKSEPELVTPIGCRFDSAGRLFVVECHTHFPPDGYAGPKADRIYVFSDSDGDGRMDRQDLFYEGGRATMGLATAPDGWVYLVTRSEISRIRDANRDGKADQVEVLVRQETQADYPHNGLSSIVFGEDGWLYFGQGENFGQPYRLTGAKGSVQSGGGEGGSLLRCRPDGSELERVATGFWNPFGTCFDTSGRLWTVENDPDSRPPCRLIHVVESGDYGFQFRFGRAGTHPLLSWNGELPGTLPMAAGTGEAPCAVLPYGGHLWVTSWGDNRIERFRIAPRGDSWQAEFSTAVQGDVQFRPVDMAVAPDGSIFVTDWVDRSYPVHQKGRLWRMIPDQPWKKSGDGLPPATEAQNWLNRLSTDSQVTFAQRWEATRSTDPFQVQAAIAGLVRFGQHTNIPSPQDPAQYQAWLQAWRWSELREASTVDAKRRRTRLLEALSHPMESIRRLAIRYTAETSEADFLVALQSNLKRAHLGAEEFAETIAAITFLKTGSASPKARDPEREKLILEVLSDLSRSALERSLALRMMPSDADQPKEEALDRWVHQLPDPAFRKEAVGLLAMRPGESAAKLLLAWVTDADLDPSTRALAAAGLASHRDRIPPILQDHLQGNDLPAMIHSEVQRALSSTTATPDLPDNQQFDAWWSVVGKGGDREAGHRVFLRSNCIRCHAYHGRGSTLGPDLGALGNTTNRKRLLESILDPSREIGPLYTTWKILTADGQVLTGSKLNGGGVGTNLKYLAADGTTFELPLKEIQEQQPSPISIMPADAVRNLTMQEVRDLLAFLE